MECFGRTDLTERDAHGEPQVIIQADESVYLHPRRAKLPRPVLTIGEHDLPDVVLERVGAVLGEREGTGPDDDPLLGAHRRRSRAEGHADGHAEGRAEERTEFARALLAARGIEVSAGFPGVPGFAELPHHAIVEAASSCASEADFRKRLLHR